MFPEALDLLLVLDVGPSMAEEQAMLARAVPAFVQALITGDVDGDGFADARAVPSLRVGIVTADMGVRGVSASVPGIVPTSCGRGVRAEYGDDGIFRGTQRSRDADPATGTTANDCDVDTVPGDDSLLPSSLPPYLTFPGSAGGDPQLTDDAAGRQEFLRRTACFANVAATGCTYAQPLEAMLKAIAPGTFEPVGGPFYAAPGDTLRGMGHGDDPTTNGGWFRNPLTTDLAILVVTDGDDCSAADGALFDASSQAYDDPDATEQATAATRCNRFGSLLHTVQRYVEGLARAREPFLPPYFGVVGGVPAGVFGTDVDSLDALLSDARMRVRSAAGVTRQGGVVTRVPDVSVAPSCTRVDMDEAFTVRGTTVVDVSMIGDATVDSQPVDPPVPVTATADLSTDGEGTTTAIVSLVRPFPRAGWSIEGASIPLGTLATEVIDESPDAGDAPHRLRLTLSAAVPDVLGETVLLGARVGPGVGMVLEGPGIDPGTRIVAVEGTNPYTLHLSLPATESRAPTSLRAAPARVAASPPVRLIEVARNFAISSSETFADVSSLCEVGEGAVGPLSNPLRRILGHLNRPRPGQSMCLARPLIRDALDRVSCDVFVTLPPNVSCQDLVAHEFRNFVAAPPDVADADGQFERCVLRQLPVTPAVRASGLPPDSTGWFYDDYTDSVVPCQSLPATISFSHLAAPLNHSFVELNCAVGAVRLEEPTVHAACNDGDRCSFSSVDAAIRFVEESRVPATFRPSFVGDPPGFGDLVCEFDTQTCQVACGSDTDCPAGWVCFDDPRDVDRLQGRGVRFCMDRTCGRDR